MIQNFLKRRRQNRQAREYEQQCNIGRRMMEDAFLAFPNFTEARMAATEALAIMQTAKENEEASNFFGGQAHAQVRSTL